MYNTETKKKKSRSVKWDHDSGVAITHIQYVNNDPVSASTPVSVAAVPPIIVATSSNRSVPTKTGKVKALPEHCPLKTGEIILDSGATLSSLPTVVDGVDGLRTSTWTMTFGGGDVHKIEQLGVIGDLKTVAIMSNIHVPVASISQLATDMKCTTVFTKDRAYVRKPGYAASFSAKDVMFTAEQSKGLYVTTTSSFIEDIKANSSAVKKE